MISHVTCHMISTRMGTEDMDYHQLAEQKDMYTGGSLSIGTHVGVHHSNLLEFEQVRERESGREVITKY